MGPDRRRITRRLTQPTHLPSSRPRLAGIVMPDGDSTPALAPRLLITLCTYNERENIEDNELEALRVVAVDMLVRDDVDHICFTGSAEVGQHIRSRIALRILHWVYHHRMTERLKHFLVRAT